MSTKYQFAGPIFRHFPKEEYALDFSIIGKIRVSTLKVCREYEDHEQGDSGEGTLHYSHDPVTSHDPNWQEVARRLGMKIGAFDKGSITGCEKHTVIPNAYVLCLSYIQFDEELCGKFGKHCVQIKDLLFFGNLVYDALVEKFGGVSGRSAKVRYRDRAYRNLEQEPKEIAFIKPEHPFAKQVEYRMVFWCDPGHVYEPFFLDVPEVRTICKYLGPLF
ncbi:hypothetical protein PS718_00427 [Pseudomonas fluorescens]|uniref:Uncharacterized protein n=1 Tax=Pseudomonas fluorescens TaxID=294 RepID=A0A5E6ZX69_PSEFL|nr:hypothetical protein [Pseudomonas fluorescens]VVN71006.1 hypothetical protein PS718_00427 [Pseudomonas fluorescens]